MEHTENWAEKIQKIKEIKKKKKKKPKICCSRKVGRSKEGQQKKKKKGKKQKDCFGITLSMRSNFCRVIY